MVCIYFTLTHLSLTKNPYFLHTNKPKNTIKNYPQVTKENPTISVPNFDQSKFNMLALKIHGELQFQTYAF
jgi:hypothetical protein